jgi:hypothetical protein
MRLCLAESDYWRSPLEQANVEVASTTMRPLIGDMMSALRKGRHVPRMTAAKRAGRRAEILGCSSVLDLTRGLQELSRSEQQWIRPTIDLVLLLRPSSHRGRPHEQGRVARSHTIAGKAFDFDIGERLFIWGFRATVQHR